MALDYFDVYFFAFVDEVFARVHQWRTLIVHMKF
jgi:hypothetical protein